MAKQLTLPMKPPRGRPALSAQECADRLVHRSRPRIPRGTPVHVTLKTDKKKLGTLRNKKVYKEIRLAMLRARHKGVRIVHFAVLGDHIHMLIESPDVLTLGQALRAMSIALSKRLSRLAKDKIKAFKNRYHLKLLPSLRQIRHALHYITQNAKKHGFTNRDTDWYCASVARLSARSVRLQEFIEEIRTCVDPPRYFVTQLATQRDHGILTVIAR